MFDQTFFNDFQYIIEISTLNKINKDESNKLSINA